MMKVVILDKVALYVWQHTIWFNAAYILVMWHTKAIKQPNRLWRTPCRHDMVSVITMTAIAVIPNQFLFFECWLLPAKQCNPSKAETGHASAPHKPSIARSVTTIMIMIIIVIILILALDIIIIMVVIVICARPDPSEAKAGAFVILLAEDADSAWAFSMRQVPLWLGRIIQIQEGSSKLQYFSRCRWECSLYKCVIYSIWDRQNARCRTRFCTALLLLH